MSPTSCSVSHLQNLSHPCLFTYWCKENMFLWDSVRGESRSEETLHQTLRNRGFSQLVGRMWREKENSHIREPASSLYLRFWEIVVESLTDEGHEGGREGAFSDIAISCRREGRVSAMKYESAVKVLDSQSSETRVLHLRVRCSDSGLWLLFTRLFYPSFPQQINKSVQPMSLW